MKYREVGLDAQATIHMKEAMEQNKPWLCQCMACQYTMRSPALVFAIQKALVKNTIKKELI